MDACGGSRRSETTETIKDMNLGEYIQHLQLIKAEYGGKLSLCYAKDDEGNGWDPLHYAPSAGALVQGEWVTEGELIEESPDQKVNAVCLN